MMTLDEIRACDRVSTAVEVYRNNHEGGSPCWSAEWALGYFCALRDLGQLNKEQWQFLCRIYQAYDSGE
jgi:hypothetical protein